MICSIITFSALVAIALAKTSAVSYPSYVKKNVCGDSTYTCVDIKLCRQALMDIPKGKYPKICNWKGSNPFVCCLDDRQENSNEISRLSPKGCGKRIVPGDNPIQNGVIYPKDTNTTLPSGIEPRSINRNFSSIYDQEDFVIPTVFAVGGTNAKWKWPWMVAIFYQNGKKQLCGGAIIDERHILTAAHCFVGKSLSPNLYTVEIGDIILTETNRKYRVQELKVHEEYKSRYHYYDIAIMRLREAVPLDVTPVCLPRDNFLREGDNVTVLGWGDLSFGGPSTKILQEVIGIPVVSNERCNAKYQTVSGLPFPRGITEDFICAGHDEGGRDACQGDSGGPLLREHTSGYWCLVGIISFGYKCAEPGFPGVYTKVADYLPWIEKFIINQNEVAREKSFDYIDGSPLWKSDGERVNFPS